MTGDRQLHNAVVAGDGGSCGSACAVTTTVEQPLAATGLNPWIVGGGIGVAILAILAGLALVLVRRRQDVDE